MIELVYIVIGVLIGFACGFFLLRSKHNALSLIAAERFNSAQAAANQQISDRDARISELASDRDKSRQEIASLNDKLQREIELRSSAQKAAEQFAVLEKQYRDSQLEIIALKQELAQIQAKAQESVKNAQEKIELLQSARQELTETFKAISADALKNNTQSFVEIAGDKMINPMKETLSKVDLQLRELEKTRNLAYVGLAEQVKNLAEGQKLLNTETASLVQALRRPEGRGRWGEMQLQRVAELAGMLEYCDFVTQDSVRDGEGKLQRPDMIVKLPGDKTIVVDSKVSLDAYLSASQVADPQQKEKLMQDHARQVREHFKQLGQKSYWANYDGSPEFAVLFIPGEAFFSAALERDPQLIEYGIERNIIIATPTTLIAMLKAVAYGWRQEKVAENARRISDLGQELYERICLLASHFDKVRDGLEKAISGYNSSVGTLESRVLVSARRFNELGVNSKKELPELRQITDSAKIINPELS
ncbi:MAG: DNA recombination protein RmuC [Sedimentisphaerales bacterium]|nr:DNA recombination protein RmuC [Sedimentisphaerales bacterium]MBN2841498.1 DNA recombination protein RmuC [Sedimentisphaerales bacterium]